MKRSVQIIDLIRRNDSDIALFRGHIDKLGGKSGTGEYIIRGLKHRNPQHRAGPIPDASIIADSTVNDLIFTFTQFINPR